MVDSSSETSHSTCNGVHCIKGLKSMIMTPRYHIITISVLVAVTGLYLCFLAKMVPFDEISVYRSDPRHVAKLMSRSDGLDVVSAAGRYAPWRRILGRLPNEPDLFRTEDGSSHHPPSHTNAPSSVPHQ